MIKQTPEDTKMFQALSQTNMGKQVVFFMRKFLNELCDIRNIKDPTKEKLEAIQDISILLEKEFIEKITLQTPKKDSEGGQYV